MKTLVNEEVPGSLAQDAGVEYLRLWSLTDGDSRKSDAEWETEYEELESASNTHAAQYSKPGFAKCQQQMHARRKLEILKEQRLLREQVDYWGDDYLTCLPVPTKA